MPHFFDRILRRLPLTSTLALIAGVSLQAQALDLQPGHDLVKGLGGAAGFGENSLAANDDSSVLVNLSTVFPAGLRFYGQTFTSVFLNNNGNLTFTNRLSTFTPTAITANTSTPMIAAWFADVQTTGAAITPTAGGNSQGSNLVYFDLDTTNHIATFTWDDVSYFGGTSDTTKRNAFQIRIYDLGDGDFAFEYRYENLAWTTGNFSGGSGGLGGVVARAGYTAGNGVNFFEFPQSGNQTQMLGLTGASNIDQPGVFLFKVQTPNVAIGVPNNGFADATAVPVTCDFPEPVTGFDAADVVVTNGVLTSLSGSGAHYDLVVTAHGEGPINVAIRANAVITQFLAGNAANQAAVVVDLTPPIVAAPAEFLTTGSGSLTGSASDLLSGLAGITWEFLDGPTTVTLADPTTLTSGFTVTQDGTYHLRLTGRDRAGNGTSSTVAVVRDTIPPNISPIATGIGRSAVPMTVTAVDATSGVANAQWQQVSGPGTLTITNVDTNGLRTAVTASTEGLYVIRATVTDRLGNHASADTTILWDVTPPLVAAGPDQTSAAFHYDLQGSASDSLSGIASTRWSVESGPGAGTFADATLPLTTFSPEVEGTYTLRLTVTDLAGNVSQAQTHITVDLPPQVQAGTDSVHRGEFVLNGQAAASNGGPVTVAWSQISGPGTANFSDSTLATSTVSCDLDGTYVLRLTATEPGGAAASDEVTLVWDATPPAPPTVASSNLGLVATNTLTLSGQAEPGSHLIATVGGIPCGTATTDNSGNWQFTTTALAEGPQTIQLVSQDTAGNNSTVTTLNVTVDTTPPTLTATFDDAGPALTAHGLTLVSSEPVVDFPALVASTTNGTAEAIVISDASHASLTITPATPGTVRVHLSPVHDAAGNASQPVDVLLLATGNLTAFSLDQATVPVSAIGTGTVDLTTTTGNVSQVPDGTWLVTLPVTGTAPKAAQTILRASDNAGRTTDATLSVTVVTPVAQ